MLNQVISKFVGSRNNRLVKRIQKISERTKALESGIQNLSDDELRAKTTEFRERLGAGESVDDLMQEAFAVAREACNRTLGLRPFDVQVVGAAAMHQGKIAEMKTGEGKTLVATLAVYLNALSGKGVHVVTVNDYLASRDAEWMGNVYRFLGLSVGVIYSGQDQEEKKQAYGADVTYGTNNEFGFDYLRDNMAFSMEEKVQRGCYYAIVDEVDSILIDEARTPLIISGPTDDDPEIYRKINKIVPKLDRGEAAKEDESLDGTGDYIVDEKQKQVFLTEQGHQNAEKLLQQAELLDAEESLYDAGNISLMHHLSAGLRAQALYQIDVDYIIADGEIVIVDEFTGRTMPGRRWSDGLHQAVEAKEGVKIQQENQTLASITFQNYFRLYDKLAGMTGTADTEAYEFQNIYKLEVVVIPTNKPMIRDDRPDLVFMTGREKFDSIAADIEENQKNGRPVLVGTASIDTSEYLSGLLKKRGLHHEVLNAKQHEREATIIAQAGSPGAVTIATNMAGRGTDIVLGGNPEEQLAEVEAEDTASRNRLEEDWQKAHQQVLDAGGLYVIGSERHESRRVDNQLRGRSGRQGDPGASRFYLSLEDDLMRIFTPPRMQGMLQRLGVEDGEAIEHRLVSKSIESAQRKVENQNFNVRKQLLEYDDVSNDQRKVIYEQRDELMGSADVSDVIADVREDVGEQFVDLYIPPQSLEELWDVAGLTEALKNEFALELPVQQWLDENNDLAEPGLRKRIHEAFATQAREKEELAGPEIMRDFEKAVMLQILDTLWQEHLAAMDYLRQGIHLRGFAQVDPKNEYKREGFEMFQNMLDKFKYEVIATIAKVQVQAEEDVEAVEAERRRQRELQYQHAAAPGMGDVPSPEEAEALAAGGAASQGEMEAEQPRPETYVRAQPKVGRNEPCPCGSGKKYKQCCGKLA